MEKLYGSFVWDSEKEAENIRKHKIGFAEAAFAFKDPERKIFADQAHSLFERRYYCLGMVNGKVITVRFTYRREKIRIIGAGFWRKGAKYYEEKTL